MRFAGELDRSTSIGASWRWFLPLLAGLVGVLAGIMVFTFGYAGGAAYFGHDPQACVQCHAMNPQFERWSKGSHKAVATCQDCHASRSRGKTRLTGRTSMRACARA